MLPLHHLPRHAHPSVEVDLHEVGAGRVRGEVKCGCGLHRGGIGGLPRLHLHQVGSIQNKSSNVTVFWNMPLYSLYTKPSVVTRTG